MNQTTPAQTIPSPAAWGFVLHHAQVIRQAASKLWTDQRIDRDDFHHDLVLDIARSHHKFDPDRSNARTWIFLRARSLKDHVLRAMRCRGDRQHDTAAILIEQEGVAVIDPAATGWGSDQEILITVELDQVMGMGTPAMREACRSHMEGWTGDQIREHFGCTMSARNDRLNRLGARVTKGCTTI